MIEMYTNREVTRWLRLMDDLEHAADPEFPGAEPAPTTDMPDEENRREV